MHLYIGYNIIELAEKGGIEMRDYVKRSWIAAVMVLVFMAQLTVAAEDMDTLAVPVEPSVLSEGQEGMAETVPDAEGGTDIIEDDADAMTVIRFQEKSSSCRIMLMLRLMDSTLYN